MLSMLFAMQAQGQTLKTRWADQVNKNNPLPEYPRPHFERGNWQNLNGQWDYALTPNTVDREVVQFNGKITVPFAIESLLSGVKQRVGKDSLLWYRTNFSVRARNNEKVMLHFGAVDWKTKVWVNGNLAGEHTGGYTAFSFDITPHLRSGSNQSLVVQVFDPTDHSYQPRGKQINNPHGIWYTPVTGIWQTVWLEKVNTRFLTGASHVPDIDRGTIHLEPKVDGDVSGLRCEASITFNGHRLYQGNVKLNENNPVQLEQVELWEPGNPALYDVVYTLYHNSRKVDEVKSYFAMRKISLGEDWNGVPRMMLNNRFLFQYGPLDQGWWPDGLYTAPTDEALKYDIEVTRDMGFNAIRKHVKVEPARWYYHCDKMGMLVWQDMPSGDMGNRWEMHPGIFGRATDKDRSPESIANFRQEWKDIVQQFSFFPSVVVWVPFNEAWGQFDTEGIVDFTRSLDSTRLINAASGGNYSLKGDIFDIHNYPEPIMPDPRWFKTGQALVLGEFGGLGLPLEGHTWQEKDNWGYQSFQNREELNKRYAEYMDRIPALIQRGLSAAIYTQTTDVEIETNGLMSYDREIIKFTPADLKRMHEKFYTLELVPDAELSTKK